MHSEAVGCRSIELQGFGRRPACQGEGEGTTFSRDEDDDTDDTDDDKIAATTQGVDKAVIRHLPPENF